MTPLIAAMSSLLPNEAADFDATEFHWFEVETTDEYIDVGTELPKLRLPFQMVAVVVQIKNMSHLLLLMQNDEGTVTGCLPLARDEKDVFDDMAFQYRTDESGHIQVAHYDGSGFVVGKGNTGGYLALITHFLLTLNSRTATGYLPVKRANHAKRIRQGKVPLYDWNTIVVEPPKPKAEPQGGTHASPRWHERRGHWRNLKNNKCVWVRNCEVGNKARGAVFHDYVVKKTV